MTVHALLKTQHRNLPKSVQILGHFKKNYHPATENLQGCISWKQKTLKKTIFPPSPNSPPLLHLHVSLTGLVIFILPWSPIFSKSLQELRSLSSPNKWLPQSPFLILDPKFLILVDACGWIFLTFGGCLFLSLLS